MTDRDIASVAKAINRLAAAQERIATAEEVIASCWQVRADLEREQLAGQIANNAIAEQIRRLMLDVRAKDKTAWADLDNRPPKPPPPPRDREMG